ncbi:gephyrin-like molybdotransferase Glp [Roseivivax sp. THAF30]|uniref:molybdopterin-binding protein n=1 Tax=Roseivivax sp. THAF30 TaxID=2587852 RepID=UPI0012680FB1|nr:Molybdopterin molybdenumtransferase [Roseivivax sp. THAF30]
MTGFDSFLVADWSAAQGVRRAGKDAIWIALAQDGAVEPARHFPTRLDAEAWIAETIRAEIAAGRRVLAAFDFPFGYPTGVAEIICGAADPLALWDWLAARITDDARGRNNRFAVAEEINALFPGEGPFWGKHNRDAYPGIPYGGRSRTAEVSEKRACDISAKASSSVWQLAFPPTVGGQALMGMPMLSRLRRIQGCAAWPFEAWQEAQAVLTEIWPGLIEPAVRASDDLRDRAQVEGLARALSRLPLDELERMMDIEASEEGWILGAGHGERLTDLARPTSLRPPPLRNDCFALPAGVDWTPVDTALALLRERLHPVTGTTKSGLFEAEGRILAEDVIARRANPPHPNTAVDGYGFAAASVGAGDVVLPLVQGRAAAGAPFEGPVPRGSALRVLTGADLPEGVDTVVLDEDCSVGDGRVAFRGGVKPGANTRKAGEDAGEGDRVLSAGRKLTAPDLALAAAVGHSTLPIREKLRVAVLSTGDELTEPGDVPGAGGIFDANRPMLLSTLARWGHVPVDLGRIPDDRSAVAAAFDRAGRDADVLLTSGGASAGDEDHVSALLREAGAMQEWRIALKPGRPLALGLWNDIPVFGLPGNPVAAFVCTLIFARPALTVLAGGNWAEPQGFEIPAAFEKRKKPGRREYLRARMRDGRAEVFPSEGSGRVSSLSWGEGLVEIEDGERHIRPGDPVRFIPYGSFGL